MNTFKRKPLLAFLFPLLVEFLALGHAAPPGEDPPADPPGEPDPIEDLDLDPPGGDPPDDPADRGAGGGNDDDDPAVLRERLRNTERERDEARRAAEEHRRAAAPIQPAQQTTSQRLYAQEEEELRNPQLDPNRRWQIEANRTLRANHESSQSALRAAEDLRDQTHYNGLVSTNPIAKKYAKRVEEKLAEVRSNGGNLARGVILKMLIGDDIVEGRVKPKAAKRTEGGEEVVRVHRGQPPVTRSNVQGRGSSSERDKRRARLEGKTI